MCACMRVCVCVCVCIIVCSVCVCVTQCTYTIAHSAVSKLSRKFDDDVETSATTSSSSGLTYLHTKSSITECIRTKLKNQAGTN